MKRILVFFCATAALVSAPRAHAVTGQILPLRPIAEPTEIGLAFNFDILVRNDEAAALTLDSVKVDFLDDRGGLLLRREINGNGSAPSVAMIPNRKIEPGEEKLYFNPFAVVPGRLKVARVSAHLVFSTPAEDAPPRTLDIDAQVSKKTATLIITPLSGRLFVWDAHDALGHHRRWDHSIPYLRSLGFSSNGMRYSYDFTVVNAANEMNKPGATRNEDWFGFGMPVHAVESGRVVSVVSSHPDDGSFDAEDSKRDINALLGNYVIIDHGGVFSAYAHLKQASATVKAGDEVRRGQVIATLGNSGSSNFPHLHFQLMDAADMHGEGLPALFRDFERMEGTRAVRVKRGSIDTGEVIRVR